MPLHGDNGSIGERGGSDHHRHLTIEGKEGTTREPKPVVHKGWGIDPILAVDSEVAFGPTNETERGIEASGLEVARLVTCETSERGRRIGRGRGVTRRGRRRGRKDTIPKARGGARVRCGETTSFGLLRRGPVVALQRTATEARSRRTGWLARGGGHWTPGRRAGVGRGRARSTTRRRHLPRIHLRRHPTPRSGRQRTRTTQRPRPLLPLEPFRPSSPSLPIMSHLLAIRLFGLQLGAEESLILQIHALCR